MPSAVLIRFHSGDMMKLFAVTCLSMSILLFAPESAFAQDAADKQQIERGIATFRTAIIDKDKDAFLKLFLNENIAWTGTTGDASIERIYARRSDPTWARLPKNFSSNPRAFIDSIAKRTARVDEIFSNVRIDSDGDVAQVWFDYSFNIGDYKQNWGKESRQMVRTGTGWKIAAVVWSQEFNPQPPPTQAAR